ncbi:MAG: D-glycero-beta-D-manno-heptose 1-phosphate adenylyltransferase [Candidatus Calescibacterium sp.]|nr:D-glycero-beta-D-manno-heptose 1-phosphate adenylyltransferase [Candidatus Calescibacterium sp.]MCX7733649.1 D-glycero-beta-D-manno-heptose 1-phosphate adenylyltransferase [bacterium]MDW8087166.1 D-glycero-beta-D-manno-heptose 1-phosphate adenylyltransferase [Candidatus Calescibacterium sp.]
MRDPQDKIVDPEKAYIISEKIRSEGKKIAFTNGCFDILHAGHVKTFLEAKKNADFLFVGINTDQSVRRLKGIRRPIIPLEMRQVVVAACEAVDYVVPFSEDTPYSLISQIQPDVLVKGEDWEESSIVGADIVKKRGGKIIRVKLVQGISTSEIIRKILNVYRE